ncbi:hypothetical protein BN1708_019167, partial [Verticillium longisporum]
ATAGRGCVRQLWRRAAPPARSTLQRPGPSGCKRGLIGRLDPGRDTDSVAPLDPRRKQPRRGQGRPRWQDVAPRAQGAERCQLGARVLWRRGLEAAPQDEQIGQKGQEVGRRRHGGRGRRRAARLL